MIDRLMMLVQSDMTEEAKTTHPATKKRVLVVKLSLCKVSSILAPLASTRSARCATEVGG